MRNLNEFNSLRDKEQGDSFERLGAECFGVFRVTSPFDHGFVMQVRVVVEYGWDHLMASSPHRTPTWNEMEFLKRLFFNDDETAFQLHVPVDEHVNIDPHCLHVWRPNDGREIPRPPSTMVGHDSWFDDFSEHVDNVRKQLATLKHQ